MKHSFSHEIVGMLSIKDRSYDVCATADADFDDVEGLLVIRLDRYLRVRDMVADEVHEDADWLPQKERVSTHVSVSEVGSTTREVFGFWVKKVRQAIPHPNRAIS